MDVEHVKIICRRQRAPNALRLAVACKIHGTNVVSDHSRKTSTTVAQVRVVEIGKWDGCSGSSTFRHGDKIGCTRDARYGIEQGGIDPTENCRVGADAKRKRNYGDGCKAGRFL